MQSVWKKDEKKEKDETKPQPSSNAAGEQNAEKSDGSKEKGTY